MLDVQNISDSMKALGVDKNSDEIKAMVKRFDVRNTGNINFDEFCIMMGPAYYVSVCSVCVCVCVYVCVCCAGMWHMKHTRNTGYVDFYHLYVMMVVPAYVSSHAW